MLQYIKYYIQVYIKRDIMYSVEQLEKKQIGLRMPKYLIDELDEFIANKAINRTDIITEATRAYIQAQQDREFYASLDESCKELKEILAGKKKAVSWEELKNELQD